MALLPVVHPEEARHVDLRAVAVAVVDHRAHPLVVEEEEVHPGEEDHEAGDRRDHHEAGDRRDHHEAEDRRDHHEAEDRPVHQVVVDRDRQE